MAMYVYEVEFYKSEDFILAKLLDLEPWITQGEDMDDAIMMAADLLKTIVDYALIHKEDLPEPTYGHKPRHGGQVIVIAVSTSLNDIDAVRASETAEILGVSRARVSHMVRDGLLQGFRRGRDSYVTRDSVNARLADPRGAGRPKTKTAQQELTTA